MERKIILTRSKDCKHSVVYAADPAEKNPPVTSIYLMRTFSAPAEMPSRIEVTIKAV